MIKQYFISVGDALSQLLNAAVFFSGNANEAFSSRCWVERDHWFYGRMRVGIDWIADQLGNPNHCAQSYLNDINRAQKVCELKDHKR